MDARFEALLPKEITARMAEEDVFRIIHKRGSLIVMAKSETDKAVWISSLEHQMNLNKSPQLGTVTASNRIIHEVPTYLPLSVLIEKPGCTVQALFNFYFRFLWEKGSYFIDSSSCPVGAILLCLEPFSCFIFCFKCPSCPEQLQYEL